MGPFMSKLLAPGEDIHYGGTIPMSDESRMVGCDMNGELLGYENFFITDASSMPKLGGKGNTFNSVVNSIYIVRQYLKRSLNNK